jgi:hypothetical protein
MKTWFSRRMILSGLLFCLAVVKTSGTQVDTSLVEKHAFSESRWEKATKDIDYSKETRAAPPKTIKGFHFPVSAGVAKIILFTLVISLLIFILVRVMAGNVFIMNKKIKEEDEFSEISPEENIHAADLEKLYNAALAAGNFRQAIRICYLVVIRELSSQQLIKWKKDKTNREYMLEMMNHSAQKHFREITFLFERIWYGEAEINEKNFQLISPRFNSFISVLKNHEPAVVPGSINV